MFNIKKRFDKGGATVSRLGNSVRGVVSGVYLNKDVGLYTVFYLVGDREYELFIPRGHIELSHTDSINVLSTVDVYGEVVFIEFGGREE